MTTLRISFFLLMGILTGCIGAGTLGGFDSRTFSTSKLTLVQAIDTLFSRHPEYQIPDKWKSFDDWEKRGYDFLDSRIFYFKSKPEEMYYVTFLGDTGNSVQINNSSTSIAIRAIDNGTPHWTLEDKTSSSEKKRIQKRFDEQIVSKLEEYTNTTSLKE